MSAQRLEVKVLISQTLAPYGAAPVNTFLYVPTFLIHTLPYTLSADLPYSAFFLNLEKKRKKTKTKTQTETKTQDSKQKNLRLEARQLL